MFFRVDVNFGQRPFVFDIEVGFFKPMMVCAMLYCWTLVNKLQWIGSTGASILLYIWEDGYRDCLAFIFSV